MAKPRIFISSTFYDLKQVRSSLEAFILGLGFEPVLSEKGSIAYSPDVPLDESCYREAQSSDVFVLIIGGRYGSEASSENRAESKGFYDRYESITRKEYESAVERDIPTYVLIEESVYSEYEIFKRNRDNASVKYAYVDSVNIFAFIDYVLTRRRNSPVYQFELSNEIEAWLREQWAGLFRELIRTRSDRAQISSLADQVSDLNSISTTLKRYLEEVVARTFTNKEQAKEIINEEQIRLSEARKLKDFAKLDLITHLDDFYSVPVERARAIFTEAKTLEDLAQKLHSETKGLLDWETLISVWHHNPEAAESISEAREVLGLPAFELADSGQSEMRKVKSIHDAKPR